MIYKCFDFYFETDLPEFNTYLLKSNDVGEMHYNVTICEQHKVSCDCVFVSKKIIGDNVITLFQNNEEHIIFHNKIGEYYINNEEKKIEIYPINRDFIVPFFINSIIAFLYGLNGVLCLHGCAIFCEGKSFLIIGDSGAGKSTLTKKILDNTDSYILSDDIVPIFLKENKIYTKFGTNILKLNNGTSNTINCINGKNLIEVLFMDKVDTVNISNLIILKNRTFKNSNYKLEKINDKQKASILYKFIKERYLLASMNECIECIIRKIVSCDFEMNFLQLNDGIEQLDRNIIYIFQDIIKGNKKE